MDQFSRLFSIPLQMLSRFLACKSITSVLKSNAYKIRHISFILKDDQIPFFTSKRILYLQESMQPVGDLVLPCNTFRMLVNLNIVLAYTSCLFAETSSQPILPAYWLKHRPSLYYLLIGLNIVPAYTTCLLA